MEEHDIFIAMMEEYPELFYDTSELEDSCNTEENDGVTQKTIGEWETWIEEEIKKKE